MTAAPVYITDAYMALMPYIFWTGIIAIISATILNIRDYSAQNGLNLPYKYTDLSNALNDAWSKLEGTSFINGLQCLDLGEKYGDKRMYWLWREFIDKDKFNVDLYGEREPSNNLKLIDKNLVSLDGSNTYDFENNKIKVKQSNHYFTNVKIKKHDLNRFIKEYKKDEKNTGKFAA